MSAHPSRATPDKARTARRSAPAAATGLRAAVNQVPAGLRLPIGSPVSAGSTDVLHMQQLLGNRIVSGLIQAKLVVGAAGDQFEQQADRVAAQVMSMPTTTGAQTAQRQPVEEEEIQTKRLVQLATEEEEEVQTKSLVQLAPEDEEEIQTKRLVQRAPDDEEEIQTKPLVQRAPEDEEEIQTKSLIRRRAEGGFEVGDAMEQRLGTLQGSGSPLPGAVRAFMEPRFGADFSGVRVHTGGEAETLNRQLGAAAFTHGQDVYFGAGRFQPDSNSGKQLLAHELTHVVQQSSSGPRIARWGANDNGTSHEEVTREAFKGVEGFSQGARDYLEEMSEQMDMRGSFWAGFAIGKLRQMFSKISKNADAYDNLIGYWRPPAERLNHAEAGAYMSDGAAADAKHVNDFVNRAVNAWDSDRPHQALTMLALGLHTAEDRGAHGDGRPGEGHDPRRIIKPPPGATKTQYYKPNWKGTDCDKRAKNGDGFDKCLPFARNMLTSFRDQVEKKELDKMKEPSGWTKAWRKWKTWWGAGYSSKEPKPGPKGKKPPFGGQQVMSPLAMTQLQEQWRKRGLIRTEQD